MRPILVCLLFIHPGAPNLISLRSAGTRLVQILERPTGQQFAPFQRPEVVSSFVFSDTTGASGCAVRCPQLAPQPKGRRIPRASKLLICGLFQEGRVLAQDGVEGVSISSISRIEGIAWNTVARWLEKAAQVCRRFNHTRIAGFAAEELQADEIRTFAGNKKTPSWVFVTIEVWSRLWPSTVTGRRSYRNTHALFHDLSRRMNFERLPLIVTDGFEFYQKVIRRFFGPACLYGQVLKTRRNGRIIKVERRALHGAAWRFEDALNNSEDSSTLNTSFIERLNLTIRQSSAYLSRRTLSHARSTERLDEHLELLRCYYNFVRPHGALKFGREIRTPAMQAGLTIRRLTF